VAGGSLPRGAVLTTEKRRPRPAPRLSILVARAADVAVIFRRGPSKWVEVIHWDTRRDLFERGHWFHGRIYQRRCDLSPDGTKLIYFVSKFSGRTAADREYTYAWTAVSKPPWLTALALWPKGDCWWGGGLFPDNHSVFLNHRPEEATPHPKHRPKRLRVEANPRASGEDDPLYSTRLTRDGWQVTQEWDWRRPTDWREGFRTVTPEHRVRRHLDGALTIRMERWLTGYRYRELFHVEDGGTSLALSLDGADSVDWDRGGRLVVLRHGKVWAADVHRGAIGPLEALIDLGPDEPEPREAPAAAQRW
jgi:hypothetical protein